MTESIPDSWKLEKRLQHPCFPQPIDARVQVWRYMDLPKFIWLLKEKRLYMSRLDKLVDSYEGSLTQKTIEGIDHFLRQHGAQQGWSGMSEIYRKHLTTTYVCCWHENDQESEAMWRLYCGQAHGIAIQTTYEHLVSAIETEHETYVGRVKYIDYERDWFPDANTFHPIMHKRIAFQHEREVRLVTSPSRIRELLPEPTPEGLSLSWNNDAWLEHVFVDPYAPEYFFEAVESVVVALAPYLKPKLEWSQMKAVPVF